MPKLQITFFRHRTRPGILGYRPFPQTSYSLNPTTGNQTGRKSSTLTSPPGRKSRFGWERFDDLAIASWNRRNILIEMLSQ